MSNHFARALERVRIQARERAEALSGAVRGARARDLRGEQSLDDQPVELPTYPDLGRYGGRSPERRSSDRDVPVVQVDGAEDWAKTYPVDVVDQARTRDGKEVSLDELAQAIAADREPGQHLGSVQAVRDGADLQRTTIAEEAQRQHAVGLIDDRTRRAAQQEPEADDSCEARHARAWQRDYEAAQRTGRPPDWAAEYADEMRAEYDSGLADDRDRHAAVHADEAQTDTGGAARLEPVTPELIRQARDWVADCQWLEDPELIEEYSDKEIVRGVARHYDGGWAGFVQTTGLEQDPDAPSEPQDTRHPAIAEAQMQFGEPCLDEPGQPDHERATAS